MIVRLLIAKETLDRLRQMEITIQSAKAARVVADEHRVSPDDVEEYIEAETERLRARNAHEIALKAWHEATRTILLEKKVPS